VGSVINDVLENTKPAVVPVPGMAATVCYASDRHAGTIISVNKKGNRLEWQRDKATRTDSYGMSDCQSYAYERNIVGETCSFRLRKNGKWVKDGESMKSGTRLVIDYRDEHYDYSF
jgi:hypothetical protein